MYHQLIGHFSSLLIATLHTENRFPQASQIPPFTYLENPQTIKTRHLHTLGIPRPSNRPIHLPWEPPAHQNAPFTYLGNPQPTKTRHLHTLGIPSPPKHAICIPWESPAHQNAPFTYLGNPQPAKRCHLLILGSLAPSICSAKIGQVL